MTVEKTDRKMPVLLFAAMLMQNKRAVIAGYRKYGK
jgi:hypothetical protein